MFAVTPSAPGTPVHSIQTMRRKSAGHSGPLPKILVANRGVSPFFSSLMLVTLTSRRWMCSLSLIFHRKLLSVSFVLHTSLRCIQLPFTPSRIVSQLIVRRYAMPLYRLSSGKDRLTAFQADEAYQVGKGLTPVGAYLAQDDIIRIALEHGVDMIHPGYVLLHFRAR